MTPSDAMGRSSALRTSVEISLMELELSLLGVNEVKSEAKLILAACIMQCECEVYTLSIAHLAKKEKLMRV